MNHSSIRQVYSVGVVPVRGFGVELPDGVFDDQVCAELRALHRDESGVDKIKQLTLGADTLFSMAEIEEILSISPPEEDWRIGETIATHYLESQCGYEFPWPASRDAKNRDGSLPGADNVGFRHCADGYVRFAFGETKTSAEKKRPPGVLYGSTGMVNQLLERMPDRTGCKQLIRYMAFRAYQGGQYAQPFREALDRYMHHDGGQAELVGAMVRPLDAHPDDLEGRCRGLAVSWPGRDLDLYALYVPSDLFGALRDRWKS